MVIDGPGSSLVTISGDNAVGVFQVASGEVATVSGLTISGGSAYEGGGILAENFSLVTISGSVISGNVADGGAGGGIASGGMLTIVDSMLSGNSAAIYGGGLITGPVTDIGSTFSTDSAGERRRRDRKLSRP